MAVRLKLRVSRGRSRGVELIALVNSGYETETPELLVPPWVAEELGLYPRLPRGSEVRDYVLADGSRTKLIRIRSAVEVRVITEDRISEPSECDIVIAEGAEEPLISDKLADALKVAIIAVGEGLWCFRDEVGRKLRKSA